MEEMKKKFPSLPPNYVSLQQLQERRLREQQKKQKEKEEEEERRIEDQRQREEKEKLKKKEEEKRKLQESRKTLEIKSKTSINRSDRSYHQKFQEKNRRVKEEIDLDSKKQESKIVVAVALEIPDPEQKLEESMMKKKKNKKKKRKQKKSPPTETLNADLKEFAPLEIDREKVVPVVQSENGEGKNELAPSEIDREKVMIPVVLSENGEGKKKMRSGFRSKSKKLPQRETGEVSLNQTVECAGGIGCLTLVDDIKKLEIDGEVGVNENRSTAKMNHGRWELRGGSRRLGWRLPPRNSNLVWVKKEENSSENSSVSHHSGGRRGGGGSVKISQPFRDHRGGRFKASHHSDGNLDEEQKMRNLKLEHIMSEGQHAQAWRATNLKDPHHHL